MLCTVIIDHKEIKAESGSSLLWAALDNGIYIPNLCSIKDEFYPVSCRLCFVEIEGMVCPVTSCSEPVRDGMVVHVNTPAVIRLRKSAFDLLLSNNKVDCAHCIKNGDCELQKIAQHHGWKLNKRNYPNINKLKPVDTSHSEIIFDPNKCVICGKCVWVCKKEGPGILDFSYRGISTEISTFASINLADSGCNSCFACTDVCPVGAIFRKNISR